MRVGGGNSFATNQNYSSMKNIHPYLALVFCLLSVQLFSQEKQDEIIAIWNTGEAEVAIYQVNEWYIGSPINSEGERNSALEILNLKYEKGKWVGKIYSRKRDKLFDVTCEVEEDKLLLEVSIGFMSRDLEWIRVN